MKNRTHLARPGAAAAVEALTISFFLASVAALLVVVAP